MKEIKIHDGDNVAVMLEDRAGGRPGHKRALCDLAPGDPVVKYGCPIGVATAPIRAGEWVHEQNLRTGLAGLTEYTYRPDFSEVKIRTTDRFMGYVRADGQVGVRNEIWILPTVGCINGLANRLAELARRDIFPETYAFPHPYGCSQLGDDLLNTRRLLAALAHHPNAGAVLLLGLGCENNRMEDQVAALGNYDPGRIRTLECQSCEDETGEALSVLRELASVVEKDTRIEVGADRLVIGVKCGGSDGFSGITANPLIGRVTDRAVGQGACVAMSEVPEMFGAETLLMNRCRDRATFEKLVDMINGFKEYFIRAEQPVYENPSPGNRAGGITTLEEKSLGCTQKSGSVPVEDVLPYGARLQKRGLSLLTAPGNDLVAATALAAAGCQLLLFSTGRGTPYGTAVPTLKIATNTGLATRKSGWIDFDAGRLLTDLSTEAATDLLWQLVLDTASGSPARNELNGCRDVAIFKTGITL